MRKNVYGLKNFTSYFDRKVIRLSSVAEYLDNRDYWSTEQTSFALNDGVLSSVVFNLTAAQMEEIEAGGIPNYAIVCEGDRILSRWYVTEGKYVREGQYELSLRRDVVADYMDEVLDADCLIDRAPLPPTSPYIYNREDMAFNQIKAGETLIKDETETAWIVGYVSDDTTDTSTVVADTDQSQTSSYPTLAQSLPGVVWNDPADPSKGGTLAACTSGIDYIDVVGVNICYLLDCLAGTCYSQCEDYYRWQNGQEYNGNQYFITCFHILDIVLKSRRL
jgi:hypothetical protein